MLFQDVVYLEQNVFTVELDDESFKVEFKLSGLPNDMKMLAFLAGELTNTATYFTTFANVGSHDSLNLSKEFSLAGDKQWKPFKYDQRVKHAGQVSNKKRSMKKTDKRNTLTKYISTELESRQEEVPLVGEYIDIARCEPLHLKNNCTKELFMKIFNIVVAESKLPSSIKAFKEIAENNLFHRFLMYVKSDMNSNYLVKKLIAWFNDNKESKKERQFGFRFRGKESYN